MTPSRAPATNGFRTQATSPARSSSTSRVGSAGGAYGLRVVFSGGRFVLQGRCRTYHAKQLVQEAALDLVGGLPQVINEIVVGQSLGP